MIKHIRIAIFLWLVFITPTLVEAQEQDGVLGELWGRVEEQYPGIASRESKVSAAKLQEHAVKGERLPQLKGQAQNT